MTGIDFDELPATFTYREARERGLSKWRLYQLRDSGVIDVVGHGLFRRADAAPVDMDLIEVAIRAPEATLCLTSALVRHGLSDAIPLEHDIAIPRGRRAHAVSAPVAWHRFEPRTFDLGRELLALDNQTSIGLYSAERCIVDAFRLAGREGPELGVQALRRWLRAGGKPVDVLEIARQFPHAMPRVRSTLEVLR